MNENENIIQFMQIVYSKSYMYILRGEDRHQVDYIFKFERKIFTVEYFELILFYITIKEGLQFFYFQIKRIFLYLSFHIIDVNVKINFCFYLYFHIILLFILFTVCFQSLASHIESI